MFQQVRILIEMVIKETYRLEKIVLHMFTKKRMP